MKAVDLFAGIGGNTFGAEAAGLNVVWAANHNPVAVEYHQLNHPRAQHACQDLQQADWSEVPRFEFGLASPCCQGHTKARGKDGPHHHKSRSTAWAPLDCAEYHRPPFFMVENVVEFVTKWKLFKHWKACWQELGYSLSINTLDAADYGAPQNRRRVFIIASRSRKPIEIKMEQRPAVPVKSILNFRDGRWSQVNKPGRSPATIARVNSGRSSQGHRFVMPYYSTGSGLTGRSLDRPIGTITTRDRWAVVDGDRMRMLTVDECRQAMTFPDTVKLPSRRRDAIQLLGNATCPALVQQVLTATLEAA